MRKKPKNKAKNPKSGSLRTTLKMYGKEDNVFFVDFEEYAYYQHLKGRTLTKIEPIKI